MNRIVWIFVWIFALPQLARSTDVGVSISIGEPGFYGRIDLGNVPRPVLVYPNAIIVETIPTGVARPPVYLRVPPGHAKHWKSYCHQYGACGQPVYFVQDAWYSDVYVPAYHESRGEHHKEHGKSEKHDHGNKGHDHD